MKTNLLATLVFIDFLLGVGGVASGVVITFSQPWLGWGMIVGGALSLFNFYYLLWGVEEIINEERVRKNEA